MLAPIDNIADRTIEHISKQIENTPELNLKPIVQGFTLDSISKVAFGIETNVHRGENKEFANQVYQIIEQFSGWGFTIFFNIFNLFPEVAAKLGFWPESAVKIRKMTHDLIADREAKNIEVGDFVDR